MNAVAGTLGLDAGSVRSNNVMGLVTTAARAYDAEVRRHGWTHIKPTSRTRRMTRGGAAFLRRRWGARARLRDAGGAG